MKNNILVSFVLSLLLFVNINANPDWKIEALENEISEVKILSKKEIKINFKEYIYFKDWYVNWDFTVLREWKTDLALKDENDNKIINFKLKEDLQINSKYNLLAISWTEASIEFSTTGQLENQVIKNDAELMENGIDFITIIDKNNIKLNFKNELESQDFDFKLFEIINITNKKGSNENNITSIIANLEKETVDSNTYMLTVLSLKNSKWEEITFNNGWYKEFWLSSITSENTDLINEITEGNLETNNTALNTEQTPDTGPATTILLLLTFLLSWIYFVYNRKRV